jgi:cytochrome c55X
VTIEVSQWTVASFAAVAVMVIAQMTSPSAAEQPNARGDPVQIDQGKVTYAQKCSHCHGPNMINSGTVTPDLRGFPDDKVRFLTTVKQGKNGKMPPWGDILNDEQLEDLWAFVASRRNP